MRIQFRGTSTGADADEYSILCGVEGTDANGIGHALSFNRLSGLTAADDPRDDWGVHTQFNDQSNGAYDRVARCRLSRLLLTVDLNGPLGNFGLVEGFDIDLDFDEKSYGALETALQRIFRDMPEVFFMD